MANMGAIAGMLAQSGANIGQAIGAPVQRLGQNIGGMLSQRAEDRRKAEELEEARKIINQYTTAGNINPGMLDQMAQEANVAGKDYLADVFSKGAKKAETNLTTGQNLTAYNELAAKAGLSPEEAAVGVRGLVSGQYKDPSTALKGTLDTQQMVKSKANKEYVVDQLNAEGLEEVAEDVERGLYTNAQIGAVLGNARQAKAAAEQGQAALVAFVNASDLSDTTFGRSASEGKLKDVPPNLISKMATEAINERQTTELVKNLKSMNRPEATEAAELLELGVITDEGAKKLIVEGKKAPTISTSNMKQYVLDDGTVVWGGDITVDGNERKAYRDPNNPNIISDLPAESVELKGESRIRAEDLKIAAISLAENEKFSSLSTVDQEKAKVAFASEYNKLITKKKTNEEALSEAKNHVLSLINQKTEKNNWWFDKTITTLQETKQDPLGLR